MSLSGFSGFRGHPIGLVALNDQGLFSCKATSLEAAHRNLIRTALCGEEGKPKSTPIDWMALRTLASITAKSIVLPPFADLQVQAQGAITTPPTFCSHKDAPSSSSSGVMLKSPAISHGPLVAAAISPALWRSSMFLQEVPSECHRYNEISVSPPRRRPSTHATETLPLDAAGEASCGHLDEDPICTWFLQAIKVPALPLPLSPAMAGAPCTCQPAALPWCWRSTHWLPWQWCSWTSIAATAGPLHPGPIRACRFLKKSKAFANCGFPEEFKITMSWKSGLPPRDAGPGFSASPTLTPLKQSCRCVTTGSQLLWHLPLH